MARLIVLAGSILLGLVVFQSVGILVLVPLFGYGEAGADLLGVIQELMVEPERFPRANLFLMLLQGFSAVGAFIFIPALYVRFLEPALRRRLHFGRVPGGLVVFLVVLTVLASMPFNSLVNYWNVGLDFPPFLEGFERWALLEEESRKVLTTFITQFNTPWELLLGVLVVAVIPGVAEEFLFRGVVQNSILDKTNNAHLAVWLAALIFSTIHLQFFGFFPRLILGAIFGYLYVWSGTIWAPVLAHFTNNFITLITIHLFNTGAIELDVNAHSRPSYSLALMSLCLSLALLFSFYKVHAPTKEDRAALH